MRLLTLIALIVSGLSSAWAVEDVDPDNDGSQYAWAGNLGWINAEPLGNGGPGWNLTDDAASGWLWSANAGWISLSCENTGSCGNVDYGVVHDGAGGLGGYGWAPNVGWVSFSCVNTASCGSVDYAVSIDPVSYEVSGFAYAPNVGWIGFSCQDTTSCGAVDFGVRLATAEIIDPIFADRFQ
jgi:hypothetical protein